MVAQAVGGGALSRMGVKGGPGEGRGEGLRDHLACRMPTGISSTQTPSLSGVFRIEIFELPLDPRQTIAQIHLDE